MNLRIADAPGLVVVLDHLLGTAGEPMLTLKDWMVLRAGGRLFYRRLPQQAPGAEDRPEVGGPYRTLGALLKDVGRLEHAEYAEPGDKEPIWEVVEWQGVWFTIHKNCFDSPTRHATKEAAMKAGRKGRRGRR